MAQKSEHELWKGYYNKGYSMGYQAGYAEGRKDALEGTVPAYASDAILHLPIQSMDLSTKAFNCLVRAGCVHVGDVAALQMNQIRVMRNLGPKTANEIACALLACGIRYTAWDFYLECSKG